MNATNDVCTHLKAAAVFCNKIGIKITRYDKLLRHCSLTRM
jgi:hypothetical protein